MPDPWFTVETPKGDTYAIRIARRSVKWRGDATAPTDAGIAKDRPRVVRVRRGLSGVELAEVLLHEFLHVSDWSKDEDWIDETAKLLATVLDEAGLIDHDTDAGA